MTAFSPLGHGQSYAKLGYQDIAAVKDDVVLHIAQRLEVTPAQVGGWCGLRLFNIHGAFIGGA